MSDTTHFVGRSVRWLVDVILLFLYFSVEEMGKFLEFSMILSFVDNFEWLGSADLDKRVAPLSDRKIKPRPVCQLVEGPYSPS